MSNFVRRIVSGNKARFKDKYLDMELDLVYVTDHIIIMGFPATGVEGFYRNRREDAKKFLDYRHGKDYWVFNFCPLCENSYPVSFFDGRVSRYPFPDHHAPPLAILPLFIREAREWLSGSENRVAVLHCKAGKGRSGTLACAYLLSLDETPSPPKLQRNLTKNEWAERRVDRIMETVETEEMNEDAPAQKESRATEGKETSTHVPGPIDTNSQHSSSEPELGSLEPRTTTPSEDDAMFSITGRPKTEIPTNLSPLSGSVTGSIGSLDMKNEKDKPNSRPNRLEDVLALHTARRMKSPSSPNEKLKQGVSIPSQQRWLHYWSLLLANAAPRDFWQAPLPHVRLLEVRVRLSNLGGVKMNLLKIANHIIEKTNTTKYGVRERGLGPVWVSLTRYNDEFVDLLERWEEHTRSQDGNMGRRRRGTEYMAGAALREIFSDGKWDKGKMIRSFTRLGHLDGASGGNQSEDRNVVSHSLRPLTDQKWEALQEEMQDPETGPRLDPETRQSLSTVGSRVSGLALSAKSSVTDFARVVDDANTEKGVILDAAREVRAKLYMGHVFMGWFWFIPAFHMPPPPSPTDSEQQPTSSATHFVLTRKEVDFPIGAGAGLVDVDVALEWVVPGLDPAANRHGPLKTQTSTDSAEGVGGEPGAGPGGIAAGVQAAVENSTGREVVEVVEASNQ